MSAGPQPPSRDHRGTIFVEDATLLSQQAFPGRQFVIRLQAPRCAAAATPGSFAHLTCDPFSTIKEPECLLKWQLIQLNVIAHSHQATLDMYRRFAPLQEKMFKHMEREIDDVEEADRWKLDDDDEEDDDPPRP